MGAVLTPHVPRNWSMLRANCQSPLVVPCPDASGTQTLKSAATIASIFSFVYRPKFAIPGCITELEAC